MQKEKTGVGTERYYQTRDRATEKVRKLYPDRWRVDVRLAEGDLIQLLTGFALDERKRWEEERDRDKSSPDTAGVRAQEYSGHPDVKLDTVAQAFAAQERAQDFSGCHEKARALGEPTFTLRAQDVSAPGLIFEWVRRNGSTCPPEKLADALRIAQAMVKWPAAKKKAAD